MAMAGCSLNDAFPDNTEKAGKIARKEEKKKAAKCKGPALSFLKGGDEKDPDRPAESPPAVPEKMKSSEPATQYFGKGETDEAFADFSPALDQNPGYKLQPDFTASFLQAGLGKAAGVPAKESNPWISMADDKPLERSISRPLPEQESETPSSTLQRRIDTLFARLETMEHHANDSASTEIALFILSGLFLLFGLETLRKFR